MQLCLFLLLSLTGVVSITAQIVRHDYHLITTPMTWSNAQTYCKKKYQNLATVLTDDDWERLNAEAARKGLATTGWVGLSNKVNSWYWSYQGIKLNSSQAYWDSGQPDNANGNEFCVAMNSNGYWADYPGTDYKPFICYDATIGGSVAVSDHHSWWGAQGYCRTYHTDLAGTNILLNADLQKWALLLGTSWIGLIRSTWVWSDLSKYSSLQWSPGCPNNIDHNDNCASVNNSLLMDRQCNSLFYFFCHTPYKVRKQVVRLQVQGDESVFVPAVQSAVLQQIVQKLKEEGIWIETNVTWMVQTDGSIFHKKSEMTFTKNLV